MSFKIIDSSIFSKDQLDTIITAFLDISDGMKPHEFEEITGISDTSAEDNFSKALDIIFNKVYKQ